MSLSISLDRGNTVEWSSHSLTGVFASPANIVSPQFHTFLRDLLYFNANAGKILLLPEDHPYRKVTIREYLNREGYSEQFASYYLIPMMAALWSASVEDVFSFPASSLVEFMCNHRMLQLFDRPQYQTPAGRSIQYTSKMAEILGEKAHTSTPIVGMKKSVKGGAIVYELFTTGNKSVGLFDHVVFACHSPQALSILESVTDIDPNLLKSLGKIEYADNVVYVHSDRELMPQRKAAWGSWNCMGKSDLLTSYHKTDGKTKHEAMEGAASGFGSKLADDSNGHTNGDVSHLEGEDGRMRGVYVTYYINRLQNLETETDVFVSLNPHTPPKKELTYRRQIMAHPQFTHETHEGRAEIKEQFQGKDGLWFCGAYMGYGFHEDGCRHGFDVATAINRVPLPWVKEEKQLVLPPPDLARFTFEQNNTLLRKLKDFITYRIPVAVCRVFVTRFLKNAITKGELQLKLNDGSLLSFGDKTPCEGDPHPVIARVFDDWFFVKIATEYDLGLARSYLDGHFLIEPLEKEEDYHWTLRSSTSTVKDETNGIIGDPVGLTRLFLLFVGNRDVRTIGLRSSKQHTMANALQNASGLAISKIGSLFNFLRFKLLMDNSERGGSLKNIRKSHGMPCLLCTCDPN
jgi:predicted NAD/FAD-binding protein